MTDRLAQLEARAAMLNIEIAKLRAEKPAAPPPPKDEGVRILQVLDETSALPNLREMKRLFAAVKALSPWPQALVDRFDENRPFRAFSSTFRWLANKPRTEFPNPKFALNYWLDDCRGWLRARNCVASDLDANALVLACFAAADVCFVPANAQLGHTWELGLAEHGGRKASLDAWRRVMTEGASAILPPSAPARRDAPPSPVRIVSGY
jgi:hypothetical protein